MLFEFGKPMKRVRLIKMCLNKTYSKVRVGKLLCDIFFLCNGPTNALVCNKTLIQMSHTKTLKIIPTCFDHHQGAF
jgi:hypothetical protein